MVAVAAVMEAPAILSALWLVARSAGGGKMEPGLIAGRGLRQSKAVLGLGPIGFAILMPLISAAIGPAVGRSIGLSLGGIVLFMILSSSASNIAVPAALPEADPSIYLTLSLGVTFPFNLTLGIPLYLAIAQTVTGG